MSREIDALIAEHVMGWDKIKAERLLFVQGEGTPYYSTDIAAAWEVVEKIKNAPKKNIYNRMTIDHWFGIDQHVDGWETGIKYCEPYSSPEYGACWAVADTVPMAICLAALKAKGVEYD